MRSLIHETPAAPPAAAQRYFAQKLAYETDCWTVHESLKAAHPDFVVIDVRGPAEFARGHLPGAINIAHLKDVGPSLRRYPEGTIFVVYGAGPHCSRADRAAEQIAEARLPVKTTIGGIVGWREEGFVLEQNAR